MVLTSFISRVRRKEGGYDVTEDRSCRRWVVALSASLRCRDFVPTGCLEQCCVNCELAVFGHTGSQTRNSKQRREGFGSVHRSLCCECARSQTIQSANERGRRQLWLYNIPGRLYYLR